jgi:hypothetical protein
MCGTTDDERRSARVTSETTPTPGIRVGHWPTARLEHARHDVTLRDQEGQPVSGRGGSPFVGFPVAPPAYRVISRIGGSER